MLQVTSFIVEGSTTTLNGRRTKDLAKNVDAQLNGFLSGFKGKLVDVKVIPEFQGANGDYAFITVLYEADEPVQQKEEPVERHHEKTKSKK